MSLLCLVTDTVIYVLVLLKGGQSGSRAVTASSLSLSYDTLLDTVETCFEYALPVVLAGFVHVCDSAYDIVVLLFQCLSPTEDSGLLQRVMEAYLPFTFVLFWLMNQYIALIQSL